ncbi:hypothetical protein [Pseudomonas putida]|uniref:hypothetical protein n=1 Tax=Pseudomonas putida TaxID=303 RepID=UPI004046BB54
MTDKTPVGLPNIEKNAMRAHVDLLRRNMPEQIEAMQLMAKIRRAQYLALVAEGFTEAQAIEICKGSLT